MVIKIRDERHMQALTGLSQTQFDRLLIACKLAYQEYQWHLYEQGLAAGKRKCKPDGGSKGKLPTIADKLLFVLYYYKVYPTFDTLGTQLAMVRSKANEHLHKLSPILYAALVQLEMMPKREFKSPEELKAILVGIDQVLIDVTERTYRRSTDNQTQREHYSGKKSVIL